MLDEEQRFGVAQKELLRQLRLEVDVLAMTRDADPAHAAHVALGPARHQRDRDAAARAAARSARTSASTTRSCQGRARAREGARRPVVLPPQPRRDDRRARPRRFASSARSFASSSSTASFRSASSRSAMLSFLAGDADVLVTTTIIESGLDIPQANTLIVERADMLGLAQLYQIRGRVGRSDVTAHAYLFYPDGQELTPEARARLAALADHTELGRRLPDRDARPRDPRRRRPARGRAVGPRRGDRLRALPRPARRGGRRALGHAPPGRSPGPGRGAGRRLRPGRLHRRRGAEDRPPPAAGARRRPRTICASCARRARTATARCPSRSRTCSRSRRRS